jgi:hypothetical protein
MANYTIKNQDEKGGTIKNKLRSFTHNVEYKAHKLSNDGKLVELENDKGNRVWADKNWLNEVNEG